MGKTFMITSIPVEPLAFQFGDGTKKECVFNSKAFAIIDMETDEGTIGSILKIAKKPTLTCVNFVFGGMKAMDSSVTREMALNIVSNLDQESIMEIINMALDSFKAVKKLTDKELTKEQKKMAEKLLVKMMQ